ncbi:trypsin-like peptidase domain-containing protein [Streptomyces sp. NPDC050145]|uniref:VMAP-C domain-containing protein n=1 Tax=Streptomyces sp. NPDC050145 TaxID=3365602 RepID=UPI003793EC70
MATPADRGELWQLTEEATVGLGAPPPSDDGLPIVAQRGARALWGSGFLVAPGWVLTCAHVLVDGPGRRARRAVRPDGTDVGVYVDGRVLRGRVAYSMPLPRAARSGPHGPDSATDLLVSEADMANPDTERSGPDLALVALLDPMDRERCAWLTDRPPGEFGSGGIVGRFAHPEGGPGLSEPESLSCGYGGTTGTRIKFELRADMRPGTSGGPLVDLERGEIVGIVKARFREGGSGIAVAVSGLRALTAAAHLDGAPDLGPDPYEELMRRHDDWHWHRQHPEHGNGEPTWVDAQRALPRRRGSWGVLDRLEALHQLGAMPPPSTSATVRELAAEALDRTVAHSVAPVGWRDGLGMLHGFGGEGDLAVHLSYLVLIAKWISKHSTEPEAAARARELYESVMKRGHALDAKQRGQLGTLRPRPRAVLLEFDHAPSAPYLDEGEEEAQQYVWSLYKGYEDGRWELARTPPADGQPFARARESALDALVGVLEAADATRADDDPVPLEVALPGTEFAAAVAEWEIREDARPSAPHSPMGIDRPVMLRDIERRAQLVDAADVAEQWRARWRGLHRAERLRLLRPAGPPVPLRRAQLKSAPHDSVPVLCQRVTAGSGHVAVQRAVGLGYPVALWRADGHGDEDGCGDSCDGFHEGVTTLLDRPGESVRTLPGRLWKLRNGAAGTDWLRGLILFYDSPDHPLPTASARPFEPPP